MDMKEGQILLERCGKVLYGRNWIGDLTKDLNVNDRRIKKWLKKNSIPPGVWEELKTLLEQRKIDIDVVLKDIE